MLVGRMVDYQLGDDAQAAAVCLAQKCPEITQRAVVRVNVAIVGDVIAVVPERRRTEGQQPDRRDAEILDVIQLPGQTAKITDAVVVAVVVGADMDFVDNRLLVPERIILRAEDVLGLTHGILLSLRGTPHGGKISPACGQTRCNHDTLFPLPVNTAAFPSRRHNDVSDDMPLEECT
jgi:hypothetical protein